jgi:hypothetical protein
MNWFLFKRKLFRKLISAAMILKKKMAHGNENEHIEEVMNQKEKKVRELINQPLSDEDSKKFNRIIKNKEAKPLEIIHPMKTIVFHGTVCGDF